MISGFGLAIAKMIGFYSQEAVHIDEFSLVSKADDFGNDDWNCEEQQSPAKLIKPCWN
jgi:hypothetical protein